MKSTLIESRSMFVSLTAIVVHCRTSEHSSGNSLTSIAGIVDSKVGPMLSPSVSVFAVGEFPKSLSKGSPVAEAGSCDSVVSSVADEARKVVLSNV